MRCLIAALLIMLAFLGAAGARAEPMQYPDAIFTSVSREETSAGPVLALRYSRTIKESGASVAGVIWLRQIGGFIVVMVGQHDPAKPDEEARLARIRDGVTRR